MKFRKTFIEGPVEFTPIQHKDERGVFSETYSQILLEKNGFNYKFIQENQTTSKKVSLEEYTVNYHHILKVS